MCHLIDLSLFLMKSTRDYEYFVWIDREYAQNKRGMLLNLRNTMNKLKNEVADRSLKREDVEKDE